MNKIKNIVILFDDTNVNVSEDHGYIKVLGLFFFCMDTDLVLDSSKLFHLSQNRMKWRF